MAGWGNGCNWEEIFISPDGVNVNQMPGFPRPSAEKISASLAANCRAADFTRYFPDFHSRPSAHPFSAPLGKSKQQMMTPQEAIYFWKMLWIQPRAHEREGYKLCDSTGLESGGRRLCNLPLDSTGEVFTWNILWTLSPLPGTSLK